VRVNERSMTQPDTPSPTDLHQFVYLANNLFELLETAKHEFERDCEAEGVAGHGVIYPAIGNRAPFEPAMVARGSSPPIYRFPKTE
jgi:hypothetical protein